MWSFGEVREDLSSYRVSLFTRPKLLFPAKAHSLETICLFFAIDYFLFYCAIIADYHDMTLGEVTIFLYA